MIPGFTWFVPTAFGISDAELAAAVTGMAAPEEVTRIRDIIHGTAQKLLEAEVLTSRGHQCMRPS